LLIILSKKLLAVTFLHGRVLDGLKKFYTQKDFHASLGRQAIFTFIILLIQLPLGIAIALTMPKKGWGVPVCLILMSMPLLIPWNVVGAMWNIFALPEIGFLGNSLNTLGF
jgi:glycerol transport system permease protein